MAGTGARARHRRAPLKATAVGVITALLGSILGVVNAPPAGAAGDPGITQLVETLDGASNSVQAWTQTLGEIGKLADSLPGVPTSPGSVLGFADLLHGIFQDADGHEALAAATDDDDLNIDDRSIDLGDGRTASLSSGLVTLGDGDKQLTLQIEAQKTVADQPLNIPLPIGSNSNAPQSAFTSTGGVDLTVDATFALQLVWDATSSTVALVANDEFPSIDLRAAATIADMEEVRAAIGLLGVQLVDPSDLTLDANFSATIADPNNDGKLSFTEAGAELAQPDSLAGLVDIGFGAPAGSLAGTLTLDAAPATSDIDLPEISATIEVAWPDISTGTPTVTPTGIDAAGKFLNMTPRDLADGLGQLVTSLTSMQRSNIGNLELPFVKGTLADAVRVSEVLAEFLTDNITTAEEDPARAGIPDFVSLQEFFDAIDEADIDLSGGSIDVSDVDWVDADSKLDFTLSLARAATDAQPLNAAGAAASGGAGSTYGEDSLTDTGQDWEPNAFVGHRVVAGSAAGTVASNTEDTITLEAPWTPAEPADGAAYTISAMQGDVGTVQLGDSLKTGTGDTARGIGAANSINATATVTPEYEASVELVLDLQPPVVHDPPMEVENPDGTTYVTGVTPIGADRVLLRTSNTQLFEADFPIDADIDIFANAGFFQVRLDGAVQVDAAGDGPMLTVDLKDQGDLTFGEVVEFLLDDPGQLLDFQVNVGADGQVDVTVPGAEDFLQGGSAGASFTWNDLRETDGDDGPKFNVDDLSELVDLDFDPQNPQALYSIILKTLQTLRTVLQDAEPGSTEAAVFNEEIPLVGRSLADLLQADESGAGPDVSYGAKTLTDESRSEDDGNAFSDDLVGRSIIVGTQIGVIADVVDENTLEMSEDWTSEPADGTPYTLRTELDDAISILEGSPSDNIQELVRLLDERLAGTPLDFSYEEIDSVPSLVLRLIWERGYSTSAPVQFDFDLGGDALTLAGVQGEGNVSLGVDGTINMGLVVPLQPGEGPTGLSDLKILDDSSIGVGLNAAIEDAYLATNLGPLSLSLGDPDDGADDRAEALASYSAALANDDASGEAISFGEFLDGVGLEINETSDPVECEGMDPVSDELAMCASLPLYISTDDGATYDKLIDPGANAFNLRLPKDGDSFEELFDISSSAPQIDGHDRLETPDPTALADAIANALLNFTDLGSIDSYLQLIEESLRAASFGGKLPLVGEDVQQGADFVGELRTALQTALGDASVNADMGSTEAVRTWVNEVLAEQLGEQNPANISLNFECPALQPPSSLDVTPEPAGGGQTIRYRIVSYQYADDGTTKEETLTTQGSTTDGPAAISGTDKVLLEWPAVEYARGYRIFREVAGQYLLIADVGEDETSFEDTTPVPTSSEQPTATENPPARDCDYQDVDGISISLDVSQGTFGADGLLDCDAAPDEANACLEESVPLDIGIPGLSLRGRDGEGPGVELGYQLHFGFGINKDDGFFIDAGTDADPPELSLGLNFTLPEEINAELAFINITARNCTNATTDLLAGAPNCSADSPAPGAAPPAFGGAFNIDVDDGADNDGRLTIAELSGASFESLFDVSLQADAQIDWLLKATVGDETAGFPGIQAEFRLDWNWDDEQPEATLPTVEFRNVAIDAGEVFGQVLGPIVNKIKSVTNPLDPIIKTLYAPIPVLSDLSRLAGGDDVTLVTLAKSFNTLAGGPDLTFVETIIGVVDFINNMPECTATCLIPIGGFQLAGDKAVNTTATPDNTESLIAPGSKQLDAGVSGSGGALGALNNKSSSGGDLGAEGSDSPSAKAGFSFPVFENPASLFNVVLGGDVDLVKFDSGNLTLGFDWRQSFGPVYAPPPVNITLSGSASVTLRIVAGFDTYGIRTAFERARAGEFELGDLGNVFLQSLFFYTTENGKPLPVVTFNGEIAAGAEVSAIIIKVGIEGGVGLSVSFLWNDPNNDGKFRLSEFLRAALNNPICLFTVSGRVYVFLRAYVTIGFSPFEVSFSFTIVDVTLLDFSATPDCEPPPPELGGVHDGGEEGDTLVVYAADLEDPRGPDYTGQESENIKITSLHDYDDQGNPVVSGVAVQMLGIRREYRNPDIKRVVVDGSAYGGKMKVVFLGDGKPVLNEDVEEDDENPPTAQFELDAYVFGGSNDDVIKTGIGVSWVDGGGGNDTIVTGDRTVLNADKTDYLRPDAYAVVAGGAGTDSISVGNGNNTVSGDSEIGVPGASLGLNAKEIVNDERDGGDPIDGDDGNKPDNDHDDTTAVGVPDIFNLTAPGADEDSGAEGDDTLKAGLGDTTIYGNGGRDTLGVATDSPLADVYPDRASLFESQGATLVGGTGDDSFAGGAHDDVIITGPDAGGLDSDPDADGGSDDGSTNTVDTGTGSDIVYGSTGVDNVIGHSLYDESDNIRGGAGNDVLVGGYGEDTVFGGPHDDYVIAEPSDVGEPGPDDGYGPFRTVAHRDLPAGIEPNFKVLVGGTGNDHIVGGDGGADIDGDGYNPVDRCVPGDPVASDPVDESVNTSDDGNDRIIGGAGVENVRAGGGNDLTEMKAADDAACGESGTDTLRGGSDDDDAWGGSGDDVLDGDTGADDLYGNDGEDTIYGDEENDFVEGNDGDDWVSGGADDDVILGGTRAAGRADSGDDLFGDTDEDVIIGDNGDDASGTWYPLDLDGATATAGGSDNLYGGGTGDWLYGGLAGDFVWGGSGDDQIEGNNADDTIFGEAGADNIIGGSSEVASGTGLARVGRPDSGDTISGGGGDDAIAGDNAIVFDGTPGHPATRDRGIDTRDIDLLDLGYTPTAGTSGGDTINGDEGIDVVLAQGAVDTVHGGAEGDYLEGGQAGDIINGNGGQDDIVGGNSTIQSDTGQAAAGQHDGGDTISGGSQGDVVIGDNGIVRRDGDPSDLTLERGIVDRAIELYDLGDAPVLGTSGDDDVVGNEHNDVVLGQSGNDRLKGNAEDDYVEGGPGQDWIEGNDGDDDLVGGSSTIHGSDNGDAARGQPDAGDVVWGGGGDDVATGDNARVTRVEPYNPLTYRIGSTGQITDRRSLRLLDQSNGAPTSIRKAPTATLFGGDQISGGSAVDVLLGQDGPDAISGGGGDDYAEGNGATDSIWGDRSLAEVGVNPPVVTWPGSASSNVELNGGNVTPGQDDLMGGSSRTGFRDANDLVHGDPAADYILGDNGTIRRIIEDNGGVLTDRIYAKRYGPTPPADAAVIRIPADGETSTRFCSTGNTPTCEPGASGGELAAFGPDLLYGDPGDDTMYGQDADDHLFGGGDDDDMYGELGGDRLFGEDGDDAMLGDRGGIVDQYENGSRAFTIDNSQVPKIFYEGFLEGTVTRQVDLQHEVIGDEFVDNDGNPIEDQSVPPAKMPFDGVAFGGNDRLRGGNGHDSIHGGVGDDLANGDSGGDSLFGDDGADVLWGGKGCDQSVDTPAASPDCYTLGIFDPNGRGTNDRMVDYLFGGAGATSGPSLDPVNGNLGSDILDWRPRGSYAPGDETKCTFNPWSKTQGPRKNPFTVDPCSWFEMTDIVDANNADNQHHQGIDWQYGGWDRDILQGDVADNGPNLGDRLLDWNGAYNLYTHCNSAYGGFNDVRQHSPLHETFIKKWAWSLGLGIVEGDISDRSTSAYDQLAFVYPGETPHGSGSAFPSTPGHFDNPNACAP